MIQVINDRRHTFAVNADGTCDIDIEGVLSTFVAPTLVDAVLIARNYDLTA